MSNLEEAKKFLRDKARQQGDHMRGCTSYVSRMLSCGYNRAARILEELVEQQFITDADERGERRLLPMTSPDPLAPTATPTEARTPMPETTEPLTAREIEDYARVAAASGDMAVQIPQDDFARILTELRARRAAEEAHRRGAEGFEEMARAWLGERGIADLSPGYSYGLTAMLASLLAQVRAQAMAEERKRRGENT